MNPASLGNLLDQMMASSTTARAVELAQPIWLSVRPGLMILAVIIVFTRLLSGRVGSAIYHAFYFGIFFAATAIWGIEILLNPTFDLFYPVSYFLTGLILRRFRD